MGNVRAGEEHLEDVEDFLESHEPCEHLRARRRGDAIIIESGPQADPSKHARLRRVSAQRWALDIADHRERWEPTPYVAALKPLLAQLATDFGWVLEPRQ